MTDAIQKQKLSRLEEEILEKILNKEIEGERFNGNPMSYPTLAYIVYKDANGRIKMGPCRGGSRNNYYSVNGTFDSWEISPFPGAWVIIRKSQIIGVRHVKAMF